MSTLHILNENGDDTLTWEASPELIAEVEAAFSDGERNDVGRIKSADEAYDLAMAELKFNEMKGMGRLTYMTKSPTDTGNDAEVVHRWSDVIEAQAAAVFAVPQTVGG